MSVKSILCAGLLAVGIGIVGLPLEVKATPGDDVRYRVAGVIVTGDKRLAVIERSDRTQGLYRPGDTIEDHQVTAIERAGVWLARQDASIFLPLEGEPVLLAEVRSVTRARDLRVTDEGQATHEVDYPKAQEAVRRMGRGASAASASESAAQGPESGSVGSGARIAESADGASAGRSEPALSDAEQLNDVLGLPTYGQIVKVDREPVTSPQMAALLVSRGLQAGRALRLEVRGVPGVEVIYTSPGDRVSDFIDMAEVPESSGGP